VKSLLRKNSHYLLLIIFFLTMGLASCGGGGGSGGGQPASTLQTNSVQSGSVAVLLTDGPTDEFAEVNITITEIELLSDEKKVQIFSGERTVDLLKLRGESSLFTLSTPVPSLTYSKIRLQVSDVELVRKDIDGNIIEVVHPKLPANGKIDLNPRTSFLVEPGSTLILQVDIDAAKSIHIVQTGNNGKYIFRPVVFVDIVGSIFAGNLVRLEGFVNDIDAANKTFALCKSDGAFQATTSSLDEDYGKGTNHLVDNCVTIHVSDATGVFDTNGDPAGFDDLQAGDFVSVIGHFNTEQIQPEGFLDFDADVIEIGGTFSFLKLRGIVISTPDSQGVFDFLLEPAQGIMGTLAVQLQMGTHIFSDSGIALTASDIQTGISASIDGTLIVSGSVPDQLKAALVILNTAEPPEMTTIQGTATQVDNVNRTLTLILSDTQSTCVVVPEDTLIFLTPADSQAESQGDGNGNVLFDTLVEGDYLDIAGFYDATGCFVARTIWKTVTGDVIVVE
jgi:hypothetical protein